MLGRIGRATVWWMSGLAHETASVMVDWNRKISSAVDGLAQTTSVMMDWNRETFSVVNGLAHGTTSLMVYVCALRI